MKFPKPVKALPTGCKEAWFYRNEKSIDVYCLPREGNAISCRITKAQIMEWLTKLEATN